MIDNRWQMLFTSHLCGCVQESDPEEMETELTRQNASDLEYDHLLQVIILLEILNKKIKKYFHIVECEKYV